MTRLRIRECRAAFLPALVAVLVLASCGGRGEEQAAAPSAGAGAPAAAPEACSVVTQADATALFGQPASPETGMSSPSMFGQCLWTWDTDTSNQLLQFHIWDKLGYDPPADSEPLDLGDGGYVRAHPVAGVDIGWIQGDRLITLSFSTIGPDAPKATERTDQVVGLARRVAERL